MIQIYDKTGREIKEHDILKIFHFIGARRKRHYMYKQVGKIVHLGKNKSPYLEIHHLNERDETYKQKINGCIHENIEIVQGFVGNISFIHRPKQPLETPTKGI